MKKIETYTTMLILAAQGESNKAIAEIMNLSERTIKNYFGIIFDILDVKNRTQAALVAHRALDLDDIKNIKNGPIEESQIKAIFGIKENNRLGFHIEYKIVSMLNSAKKRAKALKVECTITRKNLRELYTDRCPVFKTKLNWQSDGSQDDSPSLDRINITKGYTKNNIAIISRRANRAKDNATAEEHCLIADWMRGHSL